MRNVKGICLLFAVGLMAVSLYGCRNGSSIDAFKADKLLRPVFDRHDAYVKTKKNPDGSEMSDAEQSTYLRSTDMARRAIEEAKGEKTQKPEAPAAPKPAVESDPAPQQ